MNPKHGKRARRESVRRRVQEAGTGPSSSQQCSQLQSVHEHESSLLALPAEVLDNILSNLDADSLANICQCCKLFRVIDSRSGLRLVEKIARDTLYASLGEQLAARWRSVLVYCSCCFFSRSCLVLGSLLALQSITWLYVE